MSWQNASTFEDVAAVSSSYQKTVPVEAGESWQPGGLSQENFCAVMLQGGAGAGGGLTGAGGAWTENLVIRGLGHSR